MARNPSQNDNTEDDKSIDESIPRKFSNASCVGSDECYKIVLFMIFTLCLFLCPVYKIQKTWN